MHTHNKSQLDEAFSVFLKTYLTKCPLSYHSPTHGNDTDAQESYFETLEQCLACLSVIYPRRELGHPALQRTIRRKDLEPSCIHLAPLGCKNCPTGSGISRDSFFCSTNLALTPKRTIAKGVDNQNYLLNEQIISQLVESTKNGTVTLFVLTPELGFWNPWHYLYFQLKIHKIIWKNKVKGK